MLRWVTVSAVLVLWLASMFASSVHVHGSWAAAWEHGAFACLLATHAPLVGAWPFGVTR